ncbi:MAG: hypothetical protein ACFCUN_06920 [Hyphomicrobiaceae bacterium]
MVATHAFAAACGSSRPACARVKSAGRLDMRTALTSALAIALISLPLVAIPAGTASAQSAWRDAIGDLLRRDAPGPPQVATGETSGRLAQRDEDAQRRATPDEDPRAGDPAYEQARRLMSAIDRILENTAENRRAASKLPPRDSFLVPPLFAETREDRERVIRDLLDSALGIVTNVPIVEHQNTITARRKAIRDLENEIAKMRERRLDAPQSGLLPGILTDTIESLDAGIAEAEKRIVANRAEIETVKRAVREALEASGIKMTQEQVDLLLDSVLSGDLVRLVAVFNSAKLIDRQLARRMTATGENIEAARKFFAMHAALFAMLVHAQDTLVDKIDNTYLPKLSAITRDIRAARQKTEQLLKEPNRPDQKRVLEANLESQKLAEEAARGYRKYMLQQREQVAAARARAAHDLRIADNTYETVEASYQLRTLMNEATRTFEALERLEAPTFEEIFRNEELRREFENLTKRLEVPSS